MKELHMRYKDVANLTFPQAYQFAEMLRSVYKEEHRASEVGKINSVLRQMKNGNR